MYFFLSPLAQTSLKVLPCCPTNCKGECHRAPSIKQFGDKAENGPASTTSTTAEGIMGRARYIKTFSIDQIRKRLHVHHWRPILHILKFVIQNANPILFIHMGTFLNVCEMSLWWEENNDLLNLFPRTRLRLLKQRYPSHEWNLILGNQLNQWSYWSKSSLSSFGCKISRDKFSKAICRARPTDALIRIAWASETHLMQTVPALKQKD